MLVQTQALCRRAPRHERRDTRTPLPQHSQYAYAAARPAPLGVGGAGNRMQGGSTAHGVAEAPLRIARDESPPLVPLTNPPTLPPSPSSSPPALSDNVRISSSQHVRYNGRNSTRKLSRDRETRCTPVGTGCTSCVVKNTHQPCPSRHLLRLAPHPIRAAIVPAELLAHGHRPGRHKPQSPSPPAGHSRDRTPQARVVHQ